MNTKTTLFLAFLLVFAVLGYVFVRTRPGAGEDLTIPAPTVATSVISSDLLEPKLGEITKVACKRKEGEEWVFEKDEEASGAGQVVWRMTSPMQMKCVRWEVEKFGNQLGSLKYEVSHKPGDPGAITAAEAGLEPPQATVTLTDADGKTATVEIGKPASERETYVRLAGGEEIVVGKSDLRQLFKDKALDYREKQLWDFKPEDVTRVEIVDRSDAAKPMTYVFTREDARWMMASPVTARATSKVDELARNLSRLRATQWQDDRPERLAVYGLQPAMLTVRATVEEEIPVEAEEEEASAEEAEPADDDAAGEDEEAESEEQEEEPETETKVTVYVLHVSDQSPIGEDTKTYMRVGDESAVATVMKSTTDKFKPVMSEWREMGITPVDAQRATRIELTTPEGSATLVKTGGDWTFEADGGRAEATAVTDLLKTVAGLTAVAFVDEESPDLTSMGLDRPRAEIRLTIPGVEGVERIVVGGYTDEATKRLVFVRRNELASIAKVRAADADELIRGPQVYRDRAIVDVQPSRFERITLSSEGWLDGSRKDVTFQRSGNTWSMVEPIGAKVREEQMDKLVEALGGLRAEQVVAEEAEASAYGLNAPSVMVALTYKPPKEYRIENASDQPGEGDEPGEAGDTGGLAAPVEVQPPSQTIELAVTEHDGKYYALRGDRGTIYEVAGDFHKQLLAEYRTDRVLEFDDAQVRRLSIRHGDESHIFVRDGDRWIYEAEPDLPLDAKKVDNLLLQVRDLRTDRYVCYVVDDLSTYGLTEPAHEATVTLDDGTSRTLRVSARKSERRDESGVYATVEEGDGVFLLSEASLSRFQVSLDELEAGP